MQSAIHRKKRKWTELSYAVLWRTAIVRMPRLAPRMALRILAPEGPYPLIVKLPTRANHHMDVWVFLPPRNKIIHPDGHVAVHIDFRGGGFFMGSCIEQAPFCAKIARERGCVVLCPDHAMGPIRQFPAALEDAEDLLAAVLDVDQKTEAGRVLHRAIGQGYLPRMSDFRKRSSKRAYSELKLDPLRLSLSGFSSGGNLALNLILSAPLNDSSEPWPCLIPEQSSLIPVILFYPAVHQLELPADRPTAKIHGHGPGKFAQSLDKHLVPSYLPPELKHHPRANPGLIDQKLMHPKARLFVVISGKDSLVDQIEKWIAAVDEAGVVPQVETFQAPEMQHGFVNFPERMLDKTSFKKKREAYRKMQDFWDRVVSQDGFERPEGMKKVEHSKDV